MDNGRKDDIEHPTLVLNRNWQPVNVATRGAGAGAVVERVGSRRGPGDYRLYTWADWSELRRATASVHPGRAAAAARAGGPASAASAARVVRGHERSQLAEAVGHFVEHGSIALARNVLLEPRDTHAWCAPDGAMVRFNFPREHAQQSRLPGPVPPDQTDAFARVDPEIGAIQQRQVTECVGQVLEGQKGHGTAAPRSDAIANGNMMVCALPLTRQAASLSLRPYGSGWGSCPARQSR